MPIACGNDRCGDCKPQPGMIYRARTSDLKNSRMIGDIPEDVEAGLRAACRTILINNGNETEWKISEQRMPGSIKPDLSAAAETIENMKNR